MEHLLRDIKDTTVSTLAERVTEKLNSLRGLRNRLEEIHVYRESIRLAQAFGISRFCVLWVLKKRLQEMLSEVQMLCGWEIWSFFVCACVCASVSKDYLMSANVCFFLCV